MNAPLVSVIIPTYSRPVFLKRCIDSVLNQSYKNIEVLLINDGSKDCTLQICNMLARKDTRIKVIDKSNSGVSDTRNEGIRLSNGNYIMFMDCDDILLNDCIQYLMNNLNQFQVDISIGNLFKTANINSIIHNGNEVVHCFEDIKNQLYKTLYHNCFSDIQYTEGPVAKIYKKELIVKNHILFDSDLRYGEDSLFNIECYYYANSVALSNRYVYLYYDNPTSASTGNQFEYKNEIKKMIMKHLNKLKKLDLYKELYDDFNYFCYRQFQKVLKHSADNQQLSKKLFLETISNNSNVIHSVDRSKLSLKEKIKHLIFKEKMYFAYKLYYIYQK